MTHGKFLSQNTSVHFVVAVSDEITQQNILLAEVPANSLFLAYLLTIKLMIILIYRYYVHHI